MFVSRVKSVKHLARSPCYGGSHRYLYMVSAMLIRWEQSGVSHSPGFDKRDKGARGTLSDMACGSLHEARRN
jgi:hypothetical protein